MPAYEVGFTILAVDSSGSAPDLNAYADLVLNALKSLIGLGVAQASENLVGTYQGPGSASDKSASILELAITGSGMDPGIAVEALTVNGTDWLARIQRKSGMAKRKFLDFRLYPTNLQQALSGGGTKQVFQAVIQDKSALADAGTPTCISWQTVGELELDGQPLDRFVIKFDESGVAVAVEWRALGAVYNRNS